ncbi:hypothetical protein L596_030012 [Steinernema carpocapsae]|uniref:Uncharacterized protein n=1 Tax=Steinernema carpocapsae TaxID=34508 RepID=A0A4U5LRG9_STECR|nr:hypothetical protein L596_030012 [Steinernema carpocapsae]
MGDKPDNWILSSGGQGEDSGRVIYHKPVIVPALSGRTFDRDPGQRIASINRLNDRIQRRLSSHNFPKTVVNIFISYMKRFTTTFV